MKKILVGLFIFIVSSNCSFDNKTGIWKDERELKKSTNKKYEKLENVFAQNQVFNKEIQVDKSFKITIDPPYKNKNWSEKYHNHTNNVSNFYYKNKKEIILKNSKFSKSSDMSNAIIYNNHLLYHDGKGTIFVYSFSAQGKILEYNFYKKKFKKYKKKIYLIAENNKIYAADNLGYIYALNLDTGKIIWAKNFGIPFRSNIKIIDDQLILSNQDNIIYSIKISNGDKNWEFSTTPTVLKTKFENNILVDDKNSSILFLNTSGELYSINYLNRKINWFFNFSRSMSKEITELFSATPLVLKEEGILLSTGNLVHYYDSYTGEKKWNKFLPLNIKPTVTKENIFLITKNKFLICLDSSSGKIIWSRKINKINKNKELEKKLKKINKIKNLMIVNSQVFLFSSSGYLIIFDNKNGELISVNKILNSGLSSDPFFIDGYMYLFDKKKRLFKYQ